MVGGVSIDIEPAHLADHATQPTISLGHAQCVSLLPQLPGQLPRACSHSPTAMAMVCLVRSAWHEDPRPVSPVRSSRPGWSGGRLPHMRWLPSRSRYL
jgi:hypothetical protein